jgi:predicted nucleic acid-binding protein
MAAYFFDSSAIVKRYVNETGTQWVTDTLEPMAGNEIYAARISGAEVVSAIARRARGGSLTAIQAADAINQFRNEFGSICQIIEITVQVVSLAMELAETHALRGYDSVQLAAAMEINSVRVASGESALTIASSDHELNAAAIGQGLAIEDPNAYP